MQIAPTALISVSISTNVIALQACYGFTKRWVINFCELHIRHLIMPFINKCHPRYLLGEVNKLNVQLSAFRKSILITAHCISLLFVYQLEWLEENITVEKKRALTSGNLSGYPISWQCCCAFKSYMTGRMSTGRIEDTVRRNSFTCWIPAWQAVV